MFAKTTFFINFATINVAKLLTLGIVQTSLALLSLTRSFVNEFRYKSTINNVTISIMSKTTEIQIEKSRSLIEGLRLHVREMGERGVSNSEIEEMEKTVALLSEANAEVDRLREELTPKVKKMNDLMTLVKASYADSKKTLKGYYPQERWQDYGIPDKR